MTYEGLLAEIQRLTDAVGKLISTVEKLEKANNELKTQLENQIEELTKVIAEKDAEIADLKRQLGMNSNNSSKPPSSDGYKKPPAPKSLREKSGKKSGGQKGHPGRNLAQMKPDQINGCMPAKCSGCPNQEECRGKAKVLERRQVIDAVVQVEAIEYQKLRVAKCPLYGWKKEDGVFPDGVNAAVQYGKNLQALVVALNTVGAVSVSRTKELLSNLFNVPISEGTILSMVEGCAKSLSDTISKIGQHVVASEVDHADETGLRVEGSLHWAHVLCNEAFTLITLSKKRGWAGMQEIGWLPLVTGTLVHDCWSPYWNALGVVHAICCAHLLRELTGIEENNPDFTWPKAFKDLLLEMKRAREKAVQQEKSTLSRYYLHKFSQKYDKIIETAYMETPEPSVNPNRKRGRKKRGKALALVDRLKKLKGSVCLFARDFRVPFDNNQAERDLRIIKSKIKVAGCFRTVKGAQNYLDIMSYVSTAKKHGSNAYVAIQNAVSGTSDYIFA